MHYQSTNALENTIEAMLTGGTSCITKAVYTAHEGQSYDIMLEAHKSTRDWDQISDEILALTADVTSQLKNFVNRYHWLFGNKDIDLTLP